VGKGSTDKRNFRGDLMFFIFAWLKENQDGAAFEEQVPLLFLGNRLKRQSSNEIFNIIFLDGYDQLSRSFISNLKTVGFNLINLSSECRHLMKSFSKLDRFGKYEMLCFLRWPVLLHYLKAENIKKQVLHIDGDIIFNAHPEEVVNDVRGLTFVLQGCPAFVTVTNHDWFECYCEELVKFHRDIEGYSALAWKQRLGWEQSHRERWAGFRDRRIISSDQDILSHLIHTGRITQDNPLEFVKQLRLFYMENPLYFHSHAKIQLSKDSGLEFLSDGNTCYVDNKKIAFWHFQTNFVEHVSTAHVLHKLHYPSRFPNRLQTKQWGRLLSSVCRRAQRMSRRQVYSCFEELNLDKSYTSLSFANIFNRQSYWKKGVFSNPNRHYKPATVYSRKEVLG
jgi:hypothetical protein